ncbi:MAG: Tad domain-containing protein, partial [Clostridiales bacterium]|nr:Tad domain-containing protein [Clostridiales bacterium]
MKKKLWSDTHGAVTIVVSMMLIPALLLSGTAVDLARIHTAKSIAHNANQLAANAVLTEYNALTKDLYGLFGVAENDPLLAEMVDDYIQVAIFGETQENAWIDTGMGTLQLFSGSTAEADMKPAEGYTLGNPDVLRRQIEEYMKIRGPVILVSSILDAISTEGGEQLKASKGAVDQQKAVTDGMLDLFGRYRNLYDKIVIADKCEETLKEEAIKPISERLRDIKAAFYELRNRYATYDSVQGHVKKCIEDIEKEEAKEEPDTVQIEIWENLKEVYELKLEETVKRYDAERGHIAALVNGGSWQDWEMGTQNDKINPETSTKILHGDGKTLVKEWSEGYAKTGGTVQTGLKSAIDYAKNRVDAFKPKFEAVVTAAREID